jgi:hypothetical protein
MGLGLFLEFHLAGSLKVLFLCWSGVWWDTPGNWYFHRTLIYIYIDRFSLSVIKSPNTCPKFVLYRIYLVHATYIKSEIAIDLRV